MPKPINPVTFTGRTHDGKEIKLSIGRLHIGSKDRKEVPDGMNRLHGPEQVKKNITCIVWQGEENNVETLKELIIDEDHFIKGLQHLFPKGELNLLD